MIAITRSGPNRFDVDRYGPKFLNKADGTGPIAAKNNGDIGSSGTVSWASGERFNRLARPSICWPDDNLDTGDSRVQVVIANGPGYTVDPAKTSWTFTITDNDDCSSLAATPGGVVYKIQDGRTCACATESLDCNVRKLGSRDARQSEETWMDSLRRLGQQFHDPEYLYCDESPWQGLPSG